MSKDFNFFLCFFFFLHEAFFFNFTVIEKINWTFYLINQPFVRFTFLHTCIVMQNSWGDYNVLGRTLCISSPIDFEAKEADPEVHDKACPGVEHALRYRWHSERMIRVDRIGGLQGLPSLAERVLSSGLLTGYRKYNRPRLSLSRFNVPSPLNKNIVILRAAIIKRESILSDRNLLKLKKFKIF